MPKEQVEIHLRYEGPDVDDGTMSIQDIVPVLQGFAGAYGKLASQEDPSSNHRLRISAVRPGSADIVLEVWNALAHAADPLTSVSIIGSAVAATGYTAYRIIKKIVTIVQIKRHVQRQPFAERINATNSIVITNSQNVQLEVPLEMYELFKSGALDSDLNKLVSPLVAGRIDAAEIEARAADGTSLRERITSDERPYFETTETAVTATAPTWLVAKLNSLTKSTASGYLWLGDGTRAFYRYVGKELAELQRLFGTYDGPVRIWCVANMDENLKIVSVDVFEVERVQGHLFPDLEDSDGSDER